MSFQPRGPIPSPRPSRGTGPVLSVGRRVFVHCPGRTIELTDDAGSGGGSVLADGAEVEIVAWRPRGATGTRYRVQGRDAQVEGWLGGDHLRAGLSVVPTPAPATAPPSGPKTAPAKGPRTNVAR